MILVTGGTGLVGSHLLYTLAKKGEKIRAIHRKNSNLERVKTIFSYYSTNAENLFKAIEWVEADVNDIPTLEIAFQDITEVYHCAALISFDPNDYKILRKTNIDGTANIVNFCIAYSVKKLCYVSSVAALGEPLKAEKVSEKTEWNPEKDSNVYAITKYGAEMEVWRGTQEGLNVVIVNPGVIFGPGFYDSGFGNIFPTVAKGNNYYTKGSTGFVDVNDVVKAVTLLMEKNIFNERFVLVGHNKSYQQILTAIALALHQKPPKIAIKSWMLSLAWRLDWCAHLFGKKRSLSKLVAKTLHTTTVYDSSKIEQAIHFKFTPIEETISLAVLKYQEV
ncbi:NAD-dependent epimerase/dehydratase family protein [Zhouia sp. PK063]|uniref:NAD-dependent epimerase/dehydratase family protein n=1 Tax=Zhouia sp. PK063 TaxID=3373602 RepID=UPI0037A421FC